MNILGLFAALGAAISHTGLDLATKFAVGKFNPRTVLVAQWGIAGVILLLISAIWYPSLIPHPVETFANLTRPNFWQVLLADAVLKRICVILIHPCFQIFRCIYRRATRSPDTGSSFGYLSDYAAPNGFASGRARCRIHRCRRVHTRYISRRISRRIFGPLKSLFNNRGARNMLYAAIIWSITSNLDKMGVASTTPLL